MAAICSAVAQGGLTCHTLLGLAGHLPPAPQTVGGHLVFSPLAGLRGTGAPCKESSAGRQRHRLTCRSGLSSRTGQPRPPANPLGLSRRDQQDLDHLAKVYIVREGVLLKLVLEYLETSPKARLGRATHDSSSPGWDAIAIETLSTCLRGTFPSSLYEMYEAISAERKLAAGIPSRHHWPGGRRSHLRHYHHRDKQRDDQIDTEWVLRREQQRQDYQKEERRRATAAPTFIATDNVGSSWEDQGSQNPYVQLARAQRLVDAAASSLAVLREQESALQWSGGRWQSAAQRQTRQAQKALEAGRRHVACMEADLRRQEGEASRRWGDDREVPPSYRTSPSSGHSSQSSSSSRSSN